MDEHKSLPEALAAFQGEAPKLHKGEEVTVRTDKGSYKYRYLDLADIVEKIQPLMVKHGLSWSAFPCIGPDGKPALRYKLSHVSGDCESEVMSLMLAKADAQAHGSSISYARRYALCAVLNLVADADDDGAAAKAAQDRTRAQNGSPEFATAADIKALHSAAHGLQAAQIKRAFTDCGLTPPDPFVPATVFTRVPQEKAIVLAQALTETDREVFAPELT